MGMNAGTRGTTLAACVVALVLLGGTVIGLAGPRRIVRSVGSAWAGWTSEWRAGRDGRSPGDFEPSLSARIQGLTEELDRLRSDAHPREATAAELRAEIVGLKAEVAQLRKLVDRHERGMTIVTETLDQMSQPQRRVDQRR